MAIICAESHSINLLEAKESLKSNTASMIALVRKASISEEIQAARILLIQMNTHSLKSEKRNKK